MILILTCIIMIMKMMIPFVQVMMTNMGIDIYRIVTMRRIMLVLLIVVVLQAILIDFMMNIVVF